MANGLNRFLYVCGGIAAVVYVAEHLPDDKKSTGGATYQTAAYSTPAPAQPSLDSLMPESQRAFMNAVRKGQEAYKAGQNDMAKGASRPMRAREVCGALRSGRADGWIGTVYSLSSNGDGKGVLTIYLGDNIYVKTWNNAMSDISDRTLIEPDTQLFSKASALREKQAVAFSGAFSKDSTDCFRESSMTISGSMTEPEFIMRFSQVGSIN